MTRTMYDGINSDVPATPTSAHLVAGYVDGLYKWSAADWARFPNAIKVRIAVFTSTDDGHVLDCEQGNNTPASSVDWVLMRRKAGIDPTVYCGKNTWWGQIRAAFQAPGVPEPQYWVAGYSGSRQIPVGATALQYTDTGSYDLSVVADHWPGIDTATPTATSATTVTATRRNDMHIDLKPNTPVVFTNPAAALGGTSTMLLASDFGPSTVRVATFSFSTGQWTVELHDVPDTGGAVSLPLPADVNKVSVNVTEGNEQWPVGLDVLA